jgi:hypothetical protein
MSVHCCFGPLLAEVHAPATMATTATAPVLRDIVNM